MDNYEIWYNMKNNSLTFRPKFILFPDFWLPWKWYYSPWLSSLYQPWYSLFFKFFFRSRLRAIYTIRFVVPTFGIRFFQKILSVYTILQVLYHVSIFRWKYGGRSGRTSGCGCSDSFCNKKRKGEKRKRERNGQKKKVSFWSAILFMHWKEIKSWENIVFQQHFLTCLNSI